MATKPIVISMPIADRQTSFRFYRDGLNLEPIGDLADDGVPEPLQFAINDWVRLMLIPIGGFGWVIGGREVSSSASSECVLTLSADSHEHVNAVVERARQAGADVIAATGPQPWGYVGRFADPDGHIWQVRSGA